MNNSLQIPCIFCHAIQTHRPHHLTRDFCGHKPSPNNVIFTTANTVNIARTNPGVYHAKPAPLSRHEIQHALFFDSKLVYVDPNPPPPTRSLFLTHSSIIYSVLLLFISLRNSDNTYGVQPGQHRLEYSSPSMPPLPPPNFRSAVQVPLSVLLRERPNSGLSLSLLRFLCSVSVVKVT